MTIPRQPADAQASDIPGLLVSASRGDESAWREILARYGKRVFAMARSRCGRPELAEEITQSVFATIATKLVEPDGGYTEQGRFESWLFRVTMNRVRDYARRERRHAEATDPAVFGSVEARPVDADDDDAGLEVTRLRGAMTGLNDMDREVIELRHHGGMSFKQMAELLEEPIGTLLARHHRALRKLKELMTGAERTTQRSRP
ncbi:MAG: RNA polymerase sigma factor [Phycisphaerales bacterium]